MNGSELPVMQPRSPLHGATLDELGERARACRLCRLCSTRTQVVFGEGNPDADVMFVAEGPGYHDDRGGHQLSGAAGELFDQLLTAIGYTRDDVWLTSVIKCRTPDGRSSFPDEIELCEGYLFREVALVRPRVICALGNTPIRLLTGRPLRLTDLHGTPIDVSLAGNDVTVLPLYHPAAVVQVPLLIDTLRTDMRLIPGLLRRGGVAGGLSTIGDSAPEPDVAVSSVDEQMSFDMTGE